MVPSIVTTDDSFFSFGENSFSVNCWVYQNDTTSSGSSCSTYDNSAIISQWETGDSLGQNEWVLASSRPLNKPVIYLEQGSVIIGTQGNSLMGNSMNLWKMLTGVRDGDSLRIYYNGVQEAVQYIGPIIVNDVGRNLLFGTINNGLGASPCNLFSEVDLDDIGIWNKALSVCEINALYTQTQCTASISELSQDQKELVNIVDFMGRETEFRPNTPLIFIYSDGTRERVMEIEN